MKRLEKTEYPRIFTNLKMSNGNQNSQMMLFVLGRWSQERDDDAWLSLSLHSLINQCRTATTTTQIREQSACTTLYPHTTHLRVSTITHDAWTHKRTKHTVHDPGLHGEGPLEGPYKLPTWFPHTHTSSPCMEHGARWSGLAFAYCMLCIDCMYDSDQPEDISLMTLGQHNTHPLARR